MKLELASTWNIDGDRITKTIHGNSDEDNKFKDITINEYGNGHGITKIHEGTRNKKKLMNNDDISVISKGLQLLSDEEKNRLIELLKKINEPD